MQKMIPVDKLARPDNHILVPLERMFQARLDQGLSATNAMPHEPHFLKARLHGIAVGEMQAMEAAGRTLFDFPDAPWEFQLDMARQENIDNLFNFQGGRTTQENAPQVPLDIGRREIDFDATLTIAREARMLAGFTEEELERLVKAASRSAAY